MRNGRTALTAFISNSCYLILFGVCRRVREGIALIAGHAALQWIFLPRSLLDEVPPKTARRVHFRRDDFLSLSLVDLVIAYF